MVTRSRPSIQALSEVVRSLPLHSRRSIQIRMTASFMDQTSIVSTKGLTTVLMAAAYLLSVRRRARCMHGFHVPSQVAMCPCACILSVGTEVTG
jgi:hypothetical protein